MKKTFCGLLLATALPAFSETGNTLSMHSCVPLNPSDTALEKMEVLGQFTDASMNMKYTAKLQYLDTFSVSTVRTLALSASPRTSLSDPFAYTSESFVLSIEPYKSVGGTRGLHLGTVEFKKSQGENAVVSLACYNTVLF